MPGYLSNRRISFDPTQAVEDLDVDLTAVAARVTEAESNIDDLSLNIGV
jgi:hypothetical protein